MSDCQYIKDDGEQCNIDSGEKEYCHIHSSSEDDAISSSQDEDHSDASDASLSDSYTNTMVTTCSACEANVTQLGVSLTERKWNKNAVSVNVVLACDCEARTIANNDGHVYKSNLPESWYNE